MEYIATFYSHFGAVRFKKQCEQHKMPAKLMPVPRDLSSSCGTCVRYSGETPRPATKWPEELEQVVCIESAGYRQLYNTDNAGHDFAAE